MCIQGHIGRKWPGIFLQSFANSKNLANSKIEESQGAMGYFFREI